MTKSYFSGFANAAIVAALVLLVVLAGVFLVTSSRNNEQVDNTGSTSRDGSGESLESTASDSADDIEQELNALAEDEYSDSGLSDAALYE